MPLPAGADRTRLRFTASATAPSRSTSSTWSTNALINLHAPRGQGQVSGLIARRRVACLHQQWGWQLRDSSRARNGSQVVRLTNDASEDAHPAWSQDGRRIALQNRTGNWEIGPVSVTNRLGATDPSARWPAIASALIRLCRYAIKAIVLLRYGSTADLTLQEIAKPAPKDDEVLVRVHATSVNDIDWSFMRGKPYIYRLMFGVLRPKVSILGAEVAGTVEAVGSGASRFAPEDRVYGDICEAGLGGFAEYVCVRETALVHMPPRVSFQQAAALPHAAMLAWQGLVDVGKIRQGERVLINGAGGGVGTIGVQIAKAYGCEVTGVDRDFKLPALASVGFDHVIDYQQVDFTENGVLSASLRSVQSGVA